MAILWHGSPLRCYKRWVSSQVGRCLDGISAIFKVILVASSKRDHFSTRWSPEVTSKPDFFGESDILISIVELLLSQNRGNARQIQGGFSSFAFGIAAFFMSCTHQRVLPLSSSLLLPALLHPHLLPRERKAVPLPCYPADVLPNDLKHLLPGVSVPPHPRLIQFSHISRS